MSPPDTVKVLSHVSLKEVTVIASPENMKKIGDQITEWDVPIDVNEVKPRIVELYNSDPVQMATLLRTLFSEENRGNYSFYDYVFGSASAEAADRRSSVRPIDVRGSPGLKEDHRHQQSGRGV